MSTPTQPHRGQPTPADRVDQESRDTDARPAQDAAGTEPAPPPGRTVSPQQATTARQQREFGGIKIGSAFFGWLTATGLAVLLLALLTAAGAGFGYASNADASQTGTAAVKAVGLISGIILIVVIALSYYCGGYVAGRMARFNGLRQGLAVWLWGIVFAIVVAVLAAVAGSKYNLSQTLNLPRLPVGETDATVAALLFAVVAAAAALAGALTGGVAGMRFHRRVDRSGETAGTGDPADR